MDENTFDGNTLDKNTLGGRLKRYSQVTGHASGLAGKLLINKVFGSSQGGEDIAAALTQTLGTLKGPFLKAAQILSTIPDMLPPEYVQALSQLQSQAPSMGPLFARRRMQSELGPLWREKFGHFNETAVAAASLGQVHQATSLDGQLLACKLQYPNMAMTLEADLTQLKMVLSTYEAVFKALDTADVFLEIQDRLREELDYIQEAKNITIFRHILQNDKSIKIPHVFPELSTDRLLTMEWLEGKSLTAWENADQSVRNNLAHTLFTAWYSPFYHYGVLHGDPHLGNYAFDEAHHLILYDFGCIRTFPPVFIEGVIDLYHALKYEDRDKAVMAYEKWGFQNLNYDLIDTLNLWAKFLYEPLLDDRVRYIQQDLSSQPGKLVAKEIHQKLQKMGGLKPPREFVLVDRAAVALGSAFMRLRAQLNWHQLFETIIQDFNLAQLEVRQQDIKNIL